LASDYAFDFASVAPFFAGDPASREAWTEIVARVRSGDRSNTRIAEVVGAQQQRRQAPPEARAATSRLGQPGSVAIVTGQQAGLFGGPMFTLLKALSAIQLAERVAIDHHVPAVPVFWVDAEDHDWEEVHSCGVLDADAKLRAVALPRIGGAGEMPVAAVTLDESVNAAIEELSRILPQTEFTEALLGDLREVYRPGRGMADAFARWLERVLGSRGLIVFDSSDPAAKPLVADLFARELSGGRTSALAADAGTALASRGYHVQVAAQPDNVAIFQLDGVRRPIRRGTDGDHPTATELAAEALARPAGFSPNVLLRPIVQDTLFPTIAYVAGPNELAYLAQLRTIYEQFGVPMPLMYPRVSATLVDPPTRRFLMRYDLPFEALQARDESALNRLLEMSLPRAVEDAYLDASRTISASMDTLIEALPAIDPTLAGAGRSSLGRMTHELDSLHDKIVHAAKRRDETLRRQFLRAQALTFPDGQPQERAVGFVYFLNRYGPSLVDRLATDLPLDLGSHWVLAL
jgi:bacillithiol biosynthesis cysteine-adding enzyme BshC